MTQTSARIHPLLVKVPKVIAIFWIIKLLSTSVGESFADYLNETLGWGLTKTTYIMTGLMIVTLAVQIGLKRYIPVVYWLAVALVSITGTLITDNLTDGMDVPLTTSSLVFAVTLALVLFLWWRREGTLEMKSINTRTRETFYWAAILATFALGTAAGDLVSEEIGLGYAHTAWLVIALIAVIAGMWHFRLLSSVAAFWPTYILTRPLGASLGDWLTQAPTDGGLGIDTMVVSQYFFAGMVALIAVLTFSSIDRQ